MTRSPSPSALPTGVAVSPEAYDGDGPRWVVQRAEAELVERYGRLDDGELGLTAAMFEPPGGIFLVARSVGTPRPIGGVGVRSVGPALGEMKRLWVDPAWRGRGVSRSLVGALEDAAHSLGLTTLQLGTGDRQPEAVGLYESTGWVRVHVGADGRRLPVGYIRFAKRLG
ncbi:MAG: GNAT family N-acetyltransferase [Acidimicrobiales bacterium]